MAVLRHEEQQYALPADLTAETIVPTTNDSVYVKSLRRTFNWVAGSSVAADNKYAIVQTSQNANGRWLASFAAAVYTGSGATDALANGQTSVVDITVTGAATGVAAFPVVTNANALGTNVLLISASIVAANTVRVVVENQSGAAVASIPLNVTVLEF